MFKTHLLDWTELILRWTHLVVGIAWIGASFYFNWLENRLEREKQADADIAGDLWAIHGGGFYHLKKFKLGPKDLPTHLHWFKWEAYATFWTGVLLLVLIYYHEADLFLMHPSNKFLTELEGIAVAVASIAGSWFVYDWLCKSPIGKNQRTLAVIIFVYFSVLAFVMCATLGGRAVFVHIGAAMGSIMVLNVFRVIIPSQRYLVTAVETGQPLDPAPGEAALNRSRHNNYFTLPVLFLMISNHYPMTFNTHWNWLILVSLGLFGVLVRHFFNIRHLPRHKWWLPITAGSGIALLAILTAPQFQLSQMSADKVDFEIVKGIVHERCTVCHSVAPVHPGFTASPGGLDFDHEHQIKTHAQRIHSATVATRTMPLGNVTSMTEEERQILANWFQHHYMEQIAVEETTGN